MLFSRPFHHLLLSIVILAGATTLCAQSNLSLDVNAGFNGKYKRGKMTPFNVTIHRGSAEATKAELEKEEIELDLVIETQGEKHKTVVRIPEIKLPRETSKRLSAYLPMIGPEAIAYLQIGRREVANKNITLTQVFDDDYMILALGASRESLGVLSSLEVRPAMEDKNENNLMNMSAAQQQLPSEVDVSFSNSEDLPSVRSGYEAVDLIVFADFDETSLSQAQKDAMENWVFDGGRVVILGGQGLGRFSAVYQSPDSLIGNLLPGKIIGTRRQDDFSPLKQFFRGNAPNKGAVVAALAPGPSAEALSYTDAGAKRIPLLVKGSYGFGSVMFAAFDSTRPPFQGLDQSELWKYITQQLGTEYVDPRGFQNGIQRSVMNLSVTQLPSIFLIGGFLMIYMAALGPVNYFILKRLDKRSLLWLTMPATILLFLIAAYTMGLSLRGRATILNKVTIAKFAKGKPQGVARTYVGLFSPRARRYDLALGPRAETIRENVTSDDMSVGGRGKPLFVDYHTGEKEGTNVSVTDLSVAKWTMRVLQVDHAVEFPEWLEIVTEAQRLPPNQVRGANVLREVRNNSDKLLEQCVAGDSKRITTIGDIPPKTASKPNLLLQPGRAQTDWFGEYGAPAPFFSVGRRDDPAALMKRSLWYTVFSKNGRCLSLSSLEAPYFACLIEDSALDVEIRRPEYIVRNLTLLICSLESD